MKPFEIIPVAEWRKRVRAHQVFFWCKTQKRYRRVTPTRVGSGPTAKVKVECR